MELSVTLENFQTCKELVIPAGTTDHKVRMSVFDGEKNLLELQVYIKARLGGSLKVGADQVYGSNFNSLWIVWLATGMTVNLACTLYNWLNSKLDDRLVGWLVALLDVFL